MRSRVRVSEYTLTQHYIYSNDDIVLSGMKPDKRHKMDAMTDYTDLIYEQYRLADHQPASQCIDTLISCYKRYEPMDVMVNKVIYNDDAVRWMKDFWAYTQWNEHGNQCSMDEIGGIRGFVDAFVRPIPAIEYLSYDDYTNIDNEARDLISRLITIYGSLL